MLAYQCIILELNEGYTIIKNESEKVLVIAVCERGIDVYIPPMTYHRIDQKIVGITLSHQYVLDSPHHDEEDTEEEEAYDEEDTEEEEAYDDIA